MKYLILSAVFLLSIQLSGQKALPSVAIKTLDGATVNIQEYAKNGKITVISFWATWCSPCKRELDAIAEVYEDWQEEYDMELVAVTTDNARQLSKVRPLVESKRWEYIILSDVKQELQRAMNFQTVPMTFLLDENGNIVYT
ncbi:MAG: TlpA family protein disulfide reductase, partial [Saprospiraceae bacterium]|nr:TlpA family protein disulfide reductase [Saprospiraceae bacterium]